MNALLDGHGRQVTEQDTTVTHGIPVIWPNIVSDGGRKYPITSNGSKTSKYLI